LAVFSGALQIIIKIKKLKLRKEKKIDKKREKKKIRDKTFVI